MRFRQFKFLILLGILIQFMACATVTPSDEVTTVKFEYMAATTIAPAIANQFPDCVNGVGQTHFHPSWLAFGRFNMTAVGADLWTITFDDVPTDALQSLRVSDPNACANNPTGASTDNVSANGVPLSTIVETPGSGPTGLEPGLSFTVNDAGIVLP